MTTPSELQAIYTNQSQMSNYFTDKMGILSILSYANGSAIYDGVTSAYTALTNALADVPTSGGIIFFPSTENGGTYLIDSNITIPLNVTLWFADGAMLNVETGKTLTMYCKIMARLHQIFSGSGSLAGSPLVDEVYPEWFGAVGDTTTDDSVAFGKAIDLLTSIGGGKLKLNNKYKIVNTTYYLDINNFYNTIIIEGNGSTTGLVAYTYTDTYIFKLNETSLGTLITAYPSKPSLLLRNFHINGQNSTSVNILWYNTCSFKFENMHLMYIYNGVRGTGYVDLNTFDYVYWRYSRTGGWLYYNDDNGDSLYCNQIFAFDDNVVYLEDAKGATFSNCNGGNYSFKNCDAINWTGGHIEEQTNSNMIKISNSCITISNCFFWNDAVAQAPIYINDDASFEKSSNIVIDNVTILRFARTPNTRSQGDIYINNMLDSSNINIKNSFVELISTSNGYNYNQNIGLTIRSAISDLNTVLTNFIGYLNEDINIKYIDTSYYVLKNNSYNLETIALEKPSLTVAENTDFAVTNKASSLVDDTYYYVAEFVTGNGKATETSSEVSVVHTSNSGDNCIKITIPKGKGSAVRLYRGTSTGVYTNYVTFGATDNTTILYDLGGVVSGVDWITNVSTPSTVNSTGQGVYNVINGQYTMQMDALPTGGSWTNNDVIRIRNVNGSFSGYEYTCVSSGTPGTWRLSVSVVKRDTTANRPTISVTENGLMYLDTTLNANGKPIWASNGDWVDATGTIV